MLDAHCDSDYGLITNVIFSYFLIFVFTFSFITEETFASIGSEMSTSQSKLEFSARSEYASAAMKRHSRHDIDDRLTSLSDMYDSVTSDPTGSPMNEDTFEGQVLVRKEILRLVVNCSTSVGMEATEQALLV